MFDSDSKRREERMQVAGDYNINIIFNFKIFNFNLVGINFDEKTKTQNKTQ